MVLVIFVRRMPCAYNKFDNFLILYVCFILLSLSGGITGRVLALYFVAHYKRASYLILSLVCVLSCSIFIYLYYVIDYKTDFTFSSICS